MLENLTKAGFARRVCGEPRTHVRLGTPSYITGIKGSRDRSPLEQGHEARTSKSVY